MFVLDILFLSTPNHVFQLGVLGFPPYFPTGKRKAWEPNQATLSMLRAGGIGLAIDKQIKEGSVDTWIHQ